MEEKLQKSIDRAITLLGTPGEYEKYISIKLFPLGIYCCCSDCLPETWSIVNEFIAPCGPVKHEGDALVKRDENKFVLEQHESGPEIIVYLAVATASLTLIKSIIDLISIIVKGLSNERKKRPTRIKILKRQLIKGEIEEENLIEIDIPISKDMQKRLEEKIKQSIKSKN